MPIKFLSNEEIGRAIKKARLEKKLTQTELGELLGVGAAAVNKWELGIVKNIKRELMQKICLILHVHPSILIGLDRTSEDIVISEDYLFTKEEISEIKNYIEYVKYKRKSDN